MQIMHKQHTEELAFMRQQLSQLADDNKQKGVLKRKPAAASTTERSSSAAEASDTVHEHRDQRARVSDDDRPALARDEVLDTVFSFVGIGVYYYVAGVCRNWRGRYMTLCKQAAKKKQHTFHTSYWSTIVTASRLQVALDAGFTDAQLTKPKLRLAHAIAIRSLEPIAVLTLARVYGLQWSTSLSERAAWLKKYELLRWLIKCECPWDIDQLVDDVLQYDELDHLITVRAVTGPWSAEKLTSLLDGAALNDELDTVKWCHEQGAEWPESFYDVYSAPDVSKCWSLKCLQWAIANGSTWLTWRCQALSSEHYTCDSGSPEHNDDTCDKNDCDRAHATELFEWAHENGCPCTCEVAVATAATAAADV
jgi:hypothetical protein